MAMSVLGIPCKIRQSLDEAVALTGARPAKL